MPPYGRSTGESIKIYLQRILDYELVKCGIFGSFHDTHIDVNSRILSCSHKVKGVPRIICKHTYISVYVRYTQFNCTLMVGLLHSPNYIIITTPSIIPICISICLILAWFLSNPCHRVVVITMMINTK